MLLDMVAEEAANELNSLSSTPDQKQTGRVVPSLIHKNGPKEKNASVAGLLFARIGSPLSAL